MAFTPGRLVGSYPHDARNINPDLRVLFVHNPRCAGRSISTALGILSSHDTQGTLYGKYADDLPSFYKIGVVRDPLSRFISAYRWRQTEKNLRESPHETDLRRLVGLSLEECTAILLDEPKLLQQHLAPQSHYIPEPKKLDYLIRFEDIHAGWRHVCHRLRLDAELPHVNKSKVDEPQASKVVVDTVLKLYAADYDLFGYARPKPSLLHGAIGIAKAVARIDRASDEIIAARTAICQTCDQWDKGRCKQCGCFTSFKMRNASEKCPLGKWPTAHAPTTL